MAISSIARNITGSKKVEEALKLSYRYNRSLIEASLDPLVTIGTDFSNYFTEPEKAKEGYRHVFTNGEIRDYSLEVQHKDVHITPVLYNASVYRDENGEVIGVFAAARDISKLKRAEEFLAKIEIARNKEIHHRIKNNLQVISSCWIYRLKSSITESVLKIQKLWKLSE